MFSELESESNYLLVDIFTSRKDFHCNDPTLELSDGKSACENVLCYYKNILSNYT